MDTNYGSLEIDYRRGSYRPIRYGYKPDHGDLKLIVVSLLALAVIIGGLYVGSEASHTGFMHPFSDFWKTHGVNILVYSASALLLATVSLAFFKAYETSEPGKRNLFAQLISAIAWMGIIGGVLAYTDHMYQTGALSALEHNWQPILLATGGALLASWIVHRALTKEGDVFNLIVTVGMIALLTLGGLYYGEYATHSTFMQPFNHFWHEGGWELFGLFATGLIARIAYQIRHVRLEGKYVKREFDKGDRLLLAVFGIMAAVVTGIILGSLYVTAHFGGPDHVSRFNDFWKDHGVAIAEVTAITMGAIAIIAALARINNAYGVSKVLATVTVLGVVLYALTGFNAYGVAPGEHLLALMKEHQWTLLTGVALGSLVATFIAYSLRKRKQDEEEEIIVLVPEGSPRASDSLLTGTPRASDAGGIVAGITEPAGLGAGAVVNPLPPPPPPSHLDGLASGFMPPPSRIPQGDNMVFATLGGGAVVSEEPAIAADSLPPSRSIVAVPVVDLHLPLSSQASLTATMAQQGEPVAGAVPHHQQGHQQPQARSPEDIYDAARVAYEHAGHDYPIED